MPRRGGYPQNREIESTKRRSNMNARLMLPSLVLAAATATAAPPANAADVIKPIFFLPGPRVNPFGGFYVGGNAGSGWASRSGCSDILSGGVAECDDPPDGTFSYDQNGW